MNISITAPAEIKTNGFCDSIESQLERALARFAHRIARVDIALTDQNGPRGGVDKRCRVRVQMPGFEPFAATAQDENPWAAVTNAARRARRMVTTKLKRPRSRRERGRRNHRQNNDPLDL